MPCFIYREKTVLPVTTQEQCFGFQEGDLLEGRLVLMLCSRIKSSVSIVLKKLFILRIIICVKIILFVFLMWV